MKIALITDTHWGVRNDNVAFMDNSTQFLNNIFFPYIDANDIKIVVHLGDLVDRRKYININTANRLREDFLFPLEARGIETHFIAGNHDTYFKNTNKVNALEELRLESYNNFKLYTKSACEVIFDDTKLLFVPWICDNNRQSTFDTIKDTTAQIVMGHLELQGFEMYKGSMVSHGEDPSLFDKFDVVMSGHYHHRSTNGHVFYLGSHAEFTWSDYNDPRGFHIFDTETREITFIHNPYVMFEKIWYNDSDPKFQDNIIDFSKFKNKIIKVVVQNKSNPFWFEKFIESIENENPIEIQVVEDMLSLQLEDNIDIVDEAESTVDICHTYIDNIEITKVNKTELKQIISKLYAEALMIE